LWKTLAFPFVDFVYKSGAVLKIGTPEYQLRL
jgi:hypothetical protein